MSEERKTNNEKLKTKSEERKTNNEKLKTKSEKWKTKNEKWKTLLLLEIGFGGFYGGDKHTDEFFIDGQQFVFFIQFNIFCIVQ